jgi:hypothetical protein
VAAEREFKNKIERRLRFVNLARWTQSRSNPENVWRLVRMPDGDKARITVYLKAGWYGVCIARQKTKGTYFHGRVFGSQAEALSMAFELVDGM